MASDWDVEQAYPGANQLTSIYAVPSEKRAVVSTLVACNRAASDTTFRVSVAPNAEDDSEEHYLYFDEPLRGNRSFPVTIGMTLHEGTVVRVLSGNGNVSFNLFREEVDA